MNCKPGDLAIVLSTKETIDYGTVDKIVRVVKLTTSPNGLPGWYLENLILTKYGPVDGISDHLLRPIRGTEGDDETLTWKEVPNKELENV